MKRFRKVLIVLLAILVPVSIGFGFNFFSGESSDSAENRAMTVAGTLTVNKISEAQNLVPGDKICDGVTMNIKSSAVSLLRVKVDIYYAEAGSTEYTVTTDIEPIKIAKVAFNISKKKRMPYSKSIGAKDKFLALVYHILPKRIRNYLLYKIYAS